MNNIESRIKHNLLFDVNNSNNADDNDPNDDNNAKIMTVVNENSSNNEVDKDYVEFQKQKNAKKQLFELSIKKGPTCGLIVVDNFYINPVETRNYILKQDFPVKGNYPGQRTKSYANQELKNAIQKYMLGFNKVITEFPMPANPNEPNDIFNGAFQYTTSRDRSWVHTDKWNDWAGIVYLTPDAPTSSGTGFYKFRDGTVTEEDSVLLKNTDEVNRYSQDMTKWELVDVVGNVFNRLILFDAHRFHMSMNYFGDNKENGRLFQTFFFSTR
jgi:hypothetical protein